MSFYSLSLITAAPLADAPFLEIFGTGSATPNKAAGITEIGVQLVGSGPITVGLIRNAAQGTIDAAGTFYGQNESGTGDSSASGWVLGTIWTVAPTVAATPQYFRRADLSAVGQSVEWTWDPEAPLVVPAGTSLSLWAPAGVAGAICKVYVKYAIDEIVSQVRQTYNCKS